MYWEWCISPINKHDENQKFKNPFKNLSANKKCFNFWLSWMQRISENAFKIAPYFINIIGTYLLETQRSKNNGTGLYRSTQLVEKWKWFW